MSTEFKSKPVSLKAPIESVYARFANLENLKTLIDNAPADRIPADKLEQLKSIQVTPDTLTITGGPTGSVNMRVVERQFPNLIALRPDGLPLDLDMQLRFDSEGEDSTMATAVISANIPIMLKPMVKGPLQQVVDQFAVMMASIPFEN